MSVIQGAVAALQERMEVWSLAAGACTVLEFVLPVERSQSIAGKLRGILFTWVYFMTGAIAVLIVQQMLASLGWPPLLKLDLSWSTHSGNWLVLALGYTILPFSALLVSDCLYYWFHRLQHGWRPLWRFHSIHHATRELSAINHYHHVTEELFRLPFITIPMTFLIEVDAPAVAWTTLLFKVSGNLMHSNTRLTLGPLKYVWNEPRYHRVHHSCEPRHWNKNFAVMPIVDLIFGTAYFPKSEESWQTGLAEAAEPASIGEFLFPRKLPVLSATAPGEQLSGAR